LQAHVLLQAAHEDAGNLRAFFGKAGFLLDDRSEDERLVGRIEGQARITCRPQSVHDLVHPPFGAAQELQIAGAAGEEVGVREKQALGITALAELVGQPLGISRVEFHLYGRMRLDLAQSLLQGPAFDETYFVEKHLAGGQQIQQSHPVEVLRQQVFASLHAGGVVGEARVEQQISGVWQDTFAFQTAQHTAQAAAGRHVEYIGFAQLQGTGEGMAEQQCPGREAEQEEGCQEQHRLVPARECSGDHAPRTSRKRAMAAWVKGPMAHSSTFPSSSSRVRGTTPNTLLATKSSSASCSRARGISASSRRPPKCSSRCWRRMPRIPQRVSAGVCQRPSSTMNRLLRVPSTTRFS